MTSDEAVARALALVGHGVYQLGTGDIDTPNDGEFDCFGFAVCKLFGIRRHRLGFNRGPWATVSDDLNCNSAIEDSTHHQDLFEPIFTPFPGALIMYPTIYDGHGKIRVFDGHLAIGHVKIVVSVDRCLEWDHDNPDWSLLDTVECRGPNGAKPGIIAGTGAGMVAHDRRMNAMPWAKPEHRTAMLRVLS